MGNITRDELLERQEEDPGDPEDTVYVMAAGPPGSDTRTTPRIYHDDEDCHNLDDDPDESTRAEEQQRWRGPCKACVLDDVEVSDEQ